MSKTSGRRTIQFSVSETEYQVLAMMAEAKGIRTVGQFAKTLVFTAANTRPSKGIFARICGLAELVETADNGPISNSD